MIRRLAVGGARATVVAAGGGASYAAYKYQTDEGSRRAMTVYASFIPVVLHYRFVQTKHRVWPVSEEVASSEWRALDQRYAVPTVAKLAELQGMYTKYGQTAAGFTNTLSDAWVQELRKLEDQVPPRPAAVVHQTILEETGKSAAEIFASFDETPLGSASIGQVHRATLLDGREVAVKVQYPEAERLFKKDMRTIRGFFQLVDPGQLFQLEALEKQNALELDYTVEAANLTQVHANMKKRGFLPHEVEVPLPIDDLSYRRLLVMQLLPGIKLIDGLRNYARIEAARQGTTLEAMEADMRAKFEQGLLPSKYEGPTAAQIALYLRVARARDLLLNMAIGVYNVCLGWVLGRAGWHATACQPPNVPRVVDTLMRVHGWQLMGDGVFNADPHGGNFLLLPDDRIGLIDFGATKHLTRNERLSTCLIYAALYRKDEQLLVDMAQVNGYKSKYGRKDIIMTLMQFGYDTWSVIPPGQNMVQFVDDLKATDPWHEVPDNFVMGQFMSLRLRSLSLQMNHPITCSDWWGPIALQVLEAEGLPYDKWDRAMMEQYRPKMNMQVNVWG